MVDLKPTRQDHMGVEIADLDALIDTPLSFKLHGKTHTLKAVSNIVFLRFVNGLNQLYKDVQDKEVVGEQFEKTVLDLFKTVCPSLTKEDIEQNTQAQTAALFSLITDHIQGRSGPMIDTLDKKKMNKH